MDTAVLALEGRGIGRRADVGVAHHPVEGGEAAAYGPQVPYGLREEIHALREVVALAAELSAQQMVNFMAGLIKMPLLVLYQRVTQMALRH